MLDSTTPHSNDHLGINYNDLDLSSLNLKISDSNNIIYNDSSTRLKLSTYKNIPIDFPSDDQSTTNKSQLSLNFNRGLYNFHAESNLNIRFRNIF